jgi:CheY-like chemotaxis protein
VVPREGLVVEADPFRLAQAITNLLTNAAKFSPPGGRIEVRADGADGEARISVRDTGMGIAPDLLPRVFDQFVQERQPLDRSHGGLGLGLSIVHNLVALHGGTISAHSEGPGRGSEFVIRLPATTGLAAHSDQTAESNTAAAVSPPAGEVRVLVVDDNQDAADMLVAALSARGYVVRQALDGLAALQVCSEFTPHVALLDLGLPVIDGYELAARLRQLPTLEGLGLCAVTGYGQDADRARSQAAGFHRHLVKPIDLDVLERVVDELSARR